MKINGLLGLKCYQLVFYRFFLHFGIFGLLLLTGTSCTNLEITRAFDGEFSEVTNNRVINAYCTSCHNHKEFDSGLHMPKVRQKYKRRLFRRATECRTCHYFEKSWANDHTSRKTRGPRKANRGGFKEFEKNY